MAKVLLMMYKKKFMNWHKMKKILWPNLFMRQCNIIWIQQLSLIVLLVKILVYYNSGVKVGSNYPLLGELEDILREATYKATQEAPLRLNCVETFDEFNMVKILASLHLIFTGISFLVAMMQKSSLTWLVAGAPCQGPVKH